MSLDPTLSPSTLTMEHLAVGIHNPRETRSYYYADLDCERIVIGRDPSCDVCLDDQSVSRFHAVIEVRDDGASRFVDDSTYGSLINGRAVHKPVTLLGGMEIRVGRSTLYTLDEHGLIAVRAGSIYEFCHDVTKGFGGYRETERRFRAVFGENTEGRGFFSPRADKWRYFSLYGRLKPKSQKGG